MKELKNFSILAKTGSLPKENRTTKETIILGLKLFFILYAIKISTGLVVALLNVNGFIELPERVNNFYFENKFKELLIVAMYAPLYEELTFRLGLRFSKVNFSVLCTGVLYIIVVVVFDVEKPYAWLVSTILGLFFYVLIKEKNVDVIFNFWIKNQLLIFYVLLSFFSLMHLNNYVFSINMIKYFPILLLPHFIGGFIYSYARLNSGIILAIILHSLNNGLPRIVSLLTD